MGPQNPPSFHRQGRMTSGPRKSGIYSTACRSTTAPGWSQARTRNLCFHCTACPKPGHSEPRAPKSCSRRDTMVEWHQCLVHPTRHSQGPMGVPWCKCTPSPRGWGPCRTPRGWSQQQGEWTTDGIHRAAPTSGPVDLPPAPSRAHCNVDTQHGGKKEKGLCDDIPISISTGYQKLGRRQAWHDICPRRSSPSIPPMSGMVGGINN